MKVTVKNFQSLGAVDLDVEGLTVLVGRSNTGKSALIRALQGALYNLPGKEFVRLGAKNAQVAIEGLPNVSGEPLAIEWTKGTKNTYKVNGAPFSNVGQDAPPAVQAAGYRDVWIGDQEQKKGENLRPQVADQFEPLFLLTRPGSFVADVLSAVSRIAQLMNAQGRCDTDLKRAKQAAGIARSQLETVSTQATALADVPQLVDRVEFIGQQIAAVQELQRKVDTLRRLVARRQALKAFLDGQALPPETEGYGVAAVLWKRVEVLERLAPRRQKLVALRALTLPPVTEVSALPTNLPALRKLVPRRAALLKVTALAGTLPAPVDANVDAAADSLRLRDAFARHVQRRQTLLVTVRQLRAAAASTQVEVDEAEAKLASALAALKVCPVCERPTAAAAG